MDGNGTSQPFDGSWIPDTVSHFTFPATLWRLVNNPIVNSIYWDVRGHKVIIDQNLFVEQVLSPSGFFSNDSKPFKTNKFCSFIRQLNLYGFKKANKYEACLTVPACHHFFHPHFKRNHPELVCWLKRLTPKNRAKLQAGVEVKSMPLRRTWPIVKNQADSRETTNRG
uniref:HSF-type DNA-binding domain-containing protein n=1 Tax=Salarias fasciatus TaxID=181472 RepID=A0A672G0D4_SALFA